MIKQQQQQWGAAQQGLLLKLHTLVKSSRGSWSRSGSGEAAGSPLQEGVDLSQVENYERATAAAKRQQQEEEEVEAEDAANNKGHTTNTSITGKRV